MKKIALILLCLLLLTSCKDTTPMVTPSAPDESIPSSSEVNAPSSAESAEQSQESSDSAPVSDTKETQPDDVAPATETITIAVCGMEGELIFSSSVEHFEGITAFDILINTAKEKSVPVVFTGSKSSAYVTSIAGLEAGQHGGMSGWIYTLNGESIMTPCGKCVLSPGDKVEWKYITEF